MIFREVTDFSLVISDLEIYYQTLLRMLKEQDFYDVTRKRVCKNLIQFFSFQFISQRNQDIF